MLKIYIKCVYINYGHQSSFCQFSISCCLFVCLKRAQIRLFSCSNFIYSFYNIVCGAVDWHYEKFITNSINFSIVTVVTVENEISFIVAYYLYQIHAISFFALQMFFYRKKRRRKMPVYVEKLQYDSVN